MQQSNPYVGPRAFRREETLYGRETECRRLLDLIIAERIVLMYSPSGAGKTSLIEAALIPGLIEEKFVIRGPLRVGLPIADADGNSSANRYVLSALLSLEAQRSDTDTMSMEELQTLSLPEYLELHRYDIPDGAFELLIFDQFEEILTVEPVDVATKAEFFRQVGEVLHIDDYPTYHRPAQTNRASRWALFAMREESVPGLDSYRRIIPTRFQNRFRLDLLKIENAIQAMQAPAESRGVHFEDEAAKLLARDLSKVRFQDVSGDVESKPGIHVEPVQLQVVCHRLWANLPDGKTTITRADIKDFANVDHALQEYYRDTVSDVAARTGVAERNIRDWVENALITKQDIRIQIPRGVHKSGKLENRAIDAMANAYLVRVDERSNVTWYELAHDRLVEPVRTDNQAWRHENLSPLQVQAEQWEQRGRDDGLLMSGAALEDAKAWVDQQKKQKIPLESLEKEFYGRCIRARNRHRIERIVTFVLIFLTLAVLTASVVAYFQRQEALAQRQEAEVQRNEAETQRNEAELQRENAVAARDDALINESTLRSNSSLQNLAVDPVASLFQAVASLPTEADPRPYVPASELALTQAVRTSLERQYVPVLEENQLPLNLENIAVGAGDEPQLLIGGTGLRHVDVSAGEVTIIDDTAGIELLAWHDDLEMVLTTDREYGLRAWRSLEPFAAFSPPQRVNCAELSPTRAVAALCIGSELWLWDLARESVAPMNILQLPDRIAEVSWSPDGHWLAAWDESGRDRQSTMTVLDGQTGQESGPLPAHPTSIVGHAWLAGKETVHLITGSGDGTIRKWSPNDEGSEMAQSSLQGLAAIDDTRFATWSQDQVATIWTLAGPTAFLEDTENRVNEIAVSPDRAMLMTLERDNDARLWPIDIDSLATGGAQVMASSTIESIATLSGHNQLIRAAAWHPHEPYVATTGLDGAVRLWDATTGEAWTIAYGHASRDSVPGRIDIEPVAWLDRARLATLGEDGTMRTWQLFEPDGGAIRCFDPNDDQSRAKPVGALACAGHARRFTLGRTTITSAHLLPTAAELSMRATDDRGNYYAFALSDDAISPQPPPQPPPQQPYAWLCPRTLWNPTATHLVTYDDPACLASDAPALVYALADPSQGYLVEGPVVYAAWVDDLLITQDGELQMTFRTAGAGSPISEPFSTPGTVQQIVAASDLIVAGFSTGDVFVWTRTDDQGMVLINHFPGDRIDSVPIVALAVGGAQGPTVFIAADDVLVAWDPISGDERWRLPAQNALTAVAPSPYGAEIAVADRQRLLILDGETGATKWCTEAHADTIRGIRWFDGPTWPHATGIAQLPTATPCKLADDANVTAPQSMDMSVPNLRNLVLTWSGDGTARLWDLVSQAQIDQVDLGNSMETVALDESSGLLTTGTSRGELVIWQSWALDPSALLTEACEMLSTATERGERLDAPARSLVSTLCN